MSDSPRPKPHEDLQLEEIAIDRDTVPAVGAVLRRAREHHKLSLREVERRLGRSSAYLSQVERGVIRQPDPLVILELADLYKLDFMTLAKWAGWADESQASSETATSVSILIRQILELDDKARAEVMAYVQRLINAART